MDAAQMVAAETAPAGADGVLPVPSQPPEAAIAAACVEATGRALAAMEQHARQAGYAG